MSGRFEVQGRYDGGQWRRITARDDRREAARVLEDWKANAADIGLQYRLEDTALIRIDVASLPHGVAA